MADDRPLDEVEAQIAAAAAAGRGEEATALAAASWRRWLEAGDGAAGRRALAPVLDLAGPPSHERAIVLYADGLFLFREGNQTASRDRNEQALATARAAGDAEAEALALVGLSRVAFRDGSHEEVVRLAAEARGVAAGAGPAAIAAPLHMEAAGNRLLGRYDRAAELYRESMALNRELASERGVAMEQHNLGHVELRRGNVDEAATLFAARLEYAAGSPDPYERAMTAMNGAALAAALDDDELARRLLAKTKRVLEEAGIVLDPDDAFEYESLATRLR